MKKYKLGEHILIHGDSIKDREEIQKVLKDENIKIDMILTDPPYGINYSDKQEFIKKMRGHGGYIKQIENDDIVQEDYISFTQNWINTVKNFMNSYNSAYIFIDGQNLCELKQGMSVAGFIESQILVWVKDRVILSRKDYNPMHEFIIYGWLGRHKFHRGKDKSVIFHPKPQKSKLHPTMKPI